MKEKFITTNELAIKSKERTELYSTWDKRGFGDGKYYANVFKPETKVLIERGKWYCMEMMLKANDAGLNNGEQAFWINGELIGHFKNMVWRFTNDLKINSFQLGLYIHDNEKTNRIWYDDIIVSTGYIGLY